jgi:hypothetical protein
MAGLSRPFTTDFPLPAGPFQGTFWHLTFFAYLFEKAKESFANCRPIVT